jgi:hypothetical protein
MRKQDREVLMLSGVGLLMFVWWMSSRPSCGQDCQTMLQPLAKDGVTDVVRALFA